MPRAPPQPCIVPPVLDLHTDSKWFLGCWKCKREKVKRSHPRVVLTGSAWKSLKSTRSSGESMEKAHGTWNTCHTYMDTDRSHTFQIHTKLPDTPSLSKSIQRSLHQNSRDSDLWSWKATDGNKTTQLFSDTTTSRHLDTLTGPFLSLFWELDTQLVRVEGRMVPSLPAIAKTAFPKPALVPGIPSGSPSQGQVTRFYTKTLAALAMSPSELKSFPEFFWVWGAQHHVSLLHYGFLWLGSSLGCLPSFFNCSLQNFSRFSSKSESEHAPSDDLDKRVCFCSCLVLNENQNQRGESCMPCNRKSVLNSSAEYKKQLGTAQLVFLMDKKEEKTGCGFFSNPLRRYKLFKT